MANLARLNGFAFKLSGETVVRAPNAVIEVRRKDTGALAAIFSDEAGTVSITNPSDFTDADGFFSFCVAGLERGYTITGTDGSLIFTLDNVAIGTFAQLDKPQTTKGDLLVALAAGVLARKAVGADGYSLLPTSDSVDGLLWLPPGARAERIINGQIVESHVSNAVTYTLKGKGGVDLSATNPCYLLFPSATLTSGDFDIVKLTANISVTVSSGSTLGHASNIPQHTFVYALKIGGTAELFVSNLPPDYPGTFLGQRLITTTAEGGAGAADSATGVYSTTARASVPWIPVAKVKGTQTTAGTWAADPTQIDMAPFDVPLCPVDVYRSAAQAGVLNNTNTKAALDAENFDPDGVFDPTTNNRYQPNVAGIYRVTGSCFFSSTADLSDFAAKIYKNGVVAKENVFRCSGTSSEYRHTSGLILLNGTTDYIELFVLQNTGGTISLQGGSAATYLSTERLAR